MPSNAVERDAPPRRRSGVELRPPVPIAPAPPPQRGCSAPGSGGSSVVGLVDQRERALVSPHVSRASHMRRELITTHKGQQPCNSMVGSVGCFRRTTVSRGGYCRSFPPRSLETGGGAQSADRDGRLAIVLRSCAARTPSTTGRGRKR